MASQNGHYGIVEKSTTIYDTAIVRDILDIIKDNVVRLRVEKNLSQQKLADISPLSVQTIKKIEKGSPGPGEKFDNNVTVSTLQRIAGAFGVGICDLLVDREEPIPESLKKFLETPAGQAVKTAEIDKLRVIEKCLDRDMDVGEFLTLLTLIRARQDSPH